MNDRMTFKNREKWVNYAQHLRETNYALSNIQSELGFNELLLNQVKFTDEMLEIEKKSNPLDEMWANVDLSIVKIGGYYKHVHKSRSFSYDDKTEYYHVLGDSEKEKDFVECESITISKNGVYTKLQGDEYYWPERIYKRTFAIRIIDKFYVECTEDEFNKAKETCKNIKTTYDDSRK